MGAIRGELDGDGGGGDWCRDGGAGERLGLGVGASTNLNCVVTRLSDECCESYCDRFPGC